MRFSPDEVGLRNGLSGASRCEESVVIGQFCTERRVRMPHDEVLNDVCHSERRKWQPALGAVEAVVGAHAVVCRHRAPFAGTSVIPPTYPDTMAGNWAKGRNYDGLLV
jgi:hypothetical protein